MNDNNINKNHFIRIYHDKYHVTYKNASLAVNNTLELISDLLVKGQRVKLQGFGIFECHHRKSHWCMNPQKHEMFLTKDKHVAYFRPSSTLSRSIINSDYLDK